MTNKTTGPLFGLGINGVTATPGALALLERTGTSPTSLLARHLRGDWGEGIGKEDAAVNQEAIKCGSRILSSFHLGDSPERIWIITDAEVEPGVRWATTILLPEDY